MNTGPEPVVLDASAGTDAPETWPVAVALAAVTDRPFRCVPGLPEGTPRILLEMALAAFPGRIDPDGVVHASLPRAPVVELSSTLPAADWLAAFGFALGFGASRPLVRLRAPTHPVDGPGFHDLVFGHAPRLSAAGVSFEPFLVGTGLGDVAGESELLVAPVAGVRGFELQSRGVLREARIVGLVANLGVGIAVQLREAASRCLRPLGLSAEVELLPLPGSASRGIALGVVLEFEGGRFTTFLAGVPGAPADELAKRLFSRVSRLLSSRALLDATAVMQLLPLAGIAAGPLGARGRVGAWSPSPSSFSVDEVTVPLLQRAELVRRFLGVTVQVTGLPGDEGRVEVRPA